MAKEIPLILGGAEDLTNAALRVDDFPQATTVSYANDGLDIYFGSAGNSQKAHNTIPERWVSLTIPISLRACPPITGIGYGSSSPLTH